ncbi:hypothetical protein C5167_018949 [Papaver somniferum]|uniref:Uncharacterized protein n=1 Tax=Papaver somniferum TaxID=3469 RepID=A0A4Y7IS25_PAPSO|nr:hypothetical protein C5167_018949 [Papaver somniferum]
MDEKHDNIAKLRVPPQLELDMHAIKNHEHASLLIMSPANHRNRHHQKENVLRSARVNCLCSPTTHVGSFRCRHHRNSPRPRGSDSIGSNLSELGAKSGGVSDTVQV